MAIEFAHGRFTGHLVQNVGEISLQFAHPKLDLGGVGTPGSAAYLGGFKLQGEILSADQIVENSVLTPILGGGSVQMTNGHKSCRMTWNTIRTSALINTNEHSGSATNMLDNSWGIPALDAVGDVVDPDNENAWLDIVSIADMLREIKGGDGIGGTFKLMANFSHIVFGWLFRKCTLVSSNLMKISGNDIPTYQTIFNCGNPEPISDLVTTELTKDELANEDWG